MKKILLFLLLAISLILPILLIPPILANIKSTQAQKLFLLSQKEIDSSKALEDLKKAISLAKESGDWPVIASIYHYMINISPESKQFAIDAYNKAISLDPKNPKLLVDLGQVYLSDNNFTQSQDLFEKAISLDKNFPNAHYNLGQLFLKQQKINEGIKELETARDLLPDSEPQKQKLDEEISHLKKLL